MTRRIVATALVAVGVIAGAVGTASAAPYNDPHGTGQVLSSPYWDPH